MALQLREISLGLEQDETHLLLKVAHALGLDPEEIDNLSIVRVSFDARRKPRIYKVYTVQFTVENEQALLKRQSGNQRLQQVARPDLPDLPPVATPRRAMVVGMGPAGLFAALRLARQGFSVSLIERGRPVESRVRDVRGFWSGGELDPVSNVQFGEGGAGTFSDGKLTTRINHPWMRFVLQTLVGFGAPEEILVQSKPHIGTDRLRLVLINFRQALKELGVEIRYESRLTGLHQKQNTLQAAIVNETEEFPCDTLVLAPGHSARDTYNMLDTSGVAMEAKPFAVGVRVEHPVELINAIQFGHPNHPQLPAAEYALTFNDRETGRGIYSFCMCPGGEVVNASSEAGSLVVNGMSSLARAGSMSNSALVVTVRQEDLPGESPLAGVRFQREWERLAFQTGGGSHLAPAQNMMAFLGRGEGPIRSTCRPGIAEASLQETLPDFVVDGLRKALPHFDRRMRGFVTAEATLTGVETRTSSPVWILRNEEGESISHQGLFPCGEGAGYAGGIMSAALDGLRTAGHVVDKPVTGEKI